MSHRYECDRKYYLKNKEKIDEYRKKWVKEHWKELLEYKKQWRLKHHEADLERKRKWRKENPQYHTEYMRNRYNTDEEFREKMKKESLKNRKKNILKHYVREHQYRAKRKNAKGNFTIDEWQEILNKNNNKCVICGSFEHLSIDHIIPITKGGTNYASNLQPLCRGCNSRKGNKI